MSPKTRRIRVFVSYSRIDLHLVKSLVEFLRLNRSEVFLDVDSIPAGTRWRSKLTQTIKASDQFVVFWCLHASGSSGVASECRTALKHRITIVPVLLDSTPRPKELDEYQWLDFRHIGRGSHITRRYRMSGGSRKGGGAVLFVTSRRAAIRAMASRLGKRLDRELQDELATRAHAQS